MTNTTKRQEVVAEARTWLATPYEHQGRVKGAGVDCAMLLADVFYQVGLLPYIDPRPYPADWFLHRDEERYLSYVLQYGHAIDTPLPGDIALFNFGRCVSHGAIVIEWPIIIHAYREERGCCESDASKGHLATRGAGFYSMFDGP